jgi:hypothetical protein
VADLKAQYQQIWQVQQHMMMFLASFLRDHAPTNSSIQFKPNMLSIMGAQDSSNSTALESLDAQGNIRDHQYFLQELLKAGKREQSPVKKRKQLEDEIDTADSPIPLKIPARSSNVLDDALRADSLITGFSPIPKPPIDDNFNIESQSPDPMVSTWLPSPGKPIPNGDELFSDPVKELGLEIDEDPLDLNEYII